jgi:hypothetical protein
VHPRPRSITRVLAPIATVALLGGCSSDSGEPDVAGGTTTTQPTSLSMAQVETELKQYRPQAKDVSCSELEDSSIECHATLDGRPLTFYGTPSGDSVGFTVGSGAN